MVRILVADDHELTRRGLVSILERHNQEWSVVAEACDGRQAIELGRKLRPDIAIIDLSMPEANGLVVTEELCAKVPGIRILILTVLNAEPVIRQVRRAGARAFLAKHEAPAHLVTAIEALLAGGDGFTAGTVANTEDSIVPVQYLLTPREMEVLRLLASGLGNKQVANTLGMSVRTAESHRAGIMARVKAESLGELVRIAIRDGVA